MIADHCALLVIDVINDFVYGRASNIPGVENPEGLLGNIRAVIEEARSCGIPVFYVNDHFTGAESRFALEFKLVGEHALEIDEGSHVPEVVAPHEGDFIVHKKRYDGFYQTNLDLLLREIGVRTVFCVGIQTDCCVQHTVMSAFFRSFETIVIGDCCRTSAEERHDRALRYMQDYFGTKVVSAADARGLLAAMPSM